MDLLDLADRPALDDLRCHAILDIGVDLDAHLRHDLGLPRGGGSLPGLVDRVRQRLLAIDMLAAMDGRHGDRGVHVVRRGNAYGVDLLVHLIEQFPPVGKGLCPRETSGSGVPIVLMHVAQGNHLDWPLGEAADVAATLSADPDRGQSQLLAGRRMAVATEHVARNYRDAESGGGRGFEKTATFHGGRVLGGEGGSQWAGSDGQA